MNASKKSIRCKILISLSIMVFGLSAKSMSGSNCILPWEIIAQKIEKNEYFCGNIDLDLNKSPDSNDAKTQIDPNFNYSYQINDFVKIRMPGNVLTNLSSEINKVKIEKNEGDSWIQITGFSLEIQKSGIIIKNLDSEGFYKFSTVFKRDDKDVSEFTTYFIVCTNWKKDILAFTRALETELELNQDKQLFKSSIAISHFNQCMEIVSESTFLSGKVLAVLVNAVESKKTFDKGDCPNLVKGLNKIRIKRFEGSQINQFVIYIPEEYDSTKKWPVLMHPDPKQQGAEKNYKDHSGLIDIWWIYGSLKDYEWKDYEFFLNILKDKLNVDEDKMYIYGWCDDSIAAMAIALKHPDKWAECGFVMGNSFRNLAGNSLNLPVIYVKNFHAEANLTGYFNFAVKCFLYNNCRNFKYKWEEDIPEFTGKKNPLLSREKSPQRILYTIDSLSNPSAYWASINGRIDENLTGTIDANVVGQIVHVNTNNIDAYTLNIAHAPVDINKPVEIIENGQSLGFTKDNIFTKKSEKYQNAKYVKNTNLNGPILDVFKDPYVVIWGSRSKSSKLSAENEKIAQLLSNGGPCFSDSKFPAEVIDSHNIVLVGTSESNSLLEKIAKQLPVQIEADQIIANNKKYNNENMGYILVYPNPMNINKYVAVFSATSTEAISQIPKAYYDMQSIRPADVGIFEVIEKNTLKWHVLENFDTVWNWHDEYETSMTNIEKQHPQWQWRQWFAKTIKQQLKVDVFICENPFLFESSDLNGQITYRDIFNTFRNDWILKIEMNGADLRNLLATPFNDISKRDVDNLIIEGVQLVKSLPNSDVSSMGIGDLISDKTYTVALPEKCLNGQRIGMELRNYNIVGDEYVVPLLKEYFSNNKSVNIDAQLDSIKPKIF